MVTLTVKEGICSVVSFCSQRLKSPEPEISLGGSTPISWASTDLTLSAFIEAITSSPQLNLGPRYPGLVEDTTRFTQMVLVYASCPGGITHSTPFYSAEYSSVDDNLRGHLELGCYRAHSENSRLTWCLS